MFRSVNNNKVHKKLKIIVIGYRLLPINYTVIYGQNKYRVKMCVNAMLIRNDYIASINL